jgi:hypothetical protein
VNVAMFARVCSILVLLAAVPAWSQVQPAAVGDDAPAQDDQQMQTPPPVNNADYPIEVGTEARSNYLRGGLIYTTSYVDNLYVGDGGSAVAETIFTVLPTTSLDQTLPRQHISLTYSPGFTFYQPSSALNEVDQNLNAVYQYRLMPHMTLNAREDFQKSSTSYGSADSIDGGAVPGSLQPLTPGIIAPFAERLTNSASAQSSFQFSPVDMVGASGNLMKLDYPNQAEAAGLFDSNERGGGAFYNRRISPSQYMGLTYQYSWALTTPEGMESETTQTNTIQGFYTIYLRRELSMSISGGGQHYNVIQASLPSSGAWGPSIMASGGWQGQRFNVAAGFSREVTSGGGLLGVFQSNSGNANLRWQLVRTWTAGISGVYANNKSVTPLSFLYAEGGHSISGQATIQHALNKGLNINLEYDRLHENYGGIPAVSDNPNSDRVMISLAWQFERPLGR